MDGSVVIKAVLDTANVTRNVGNLNRELQGISWSNIAAGDAKAMALASAFGAAGKAATIGLTVPLAAVGTAAIGMALGFEDAMAKVSTIADTTEVPMDQLKASILDLSDQTGVSANEIADNVYNAISAGQKTGDAVAFVSNATKLATAGFTDSASALDILSTTMNAYSLEADQVGKVSDILLMTQNKGKTTVGELSQAMGRAIPTASAFKVNLENLAAAYATTTAKGINTAESTTYINSMLNELGDGSSAVGKIIQDKLGMSFSEAMESGMSLGDVLGTVQEHASDTGVTMFDLFGSAEGAKAAFAIAGEGADGFTANLDAMKNSTGATDEAYKKMETTSYKLKRAVEEVKNTLIDLGGNLAETLMPAIEGAVGAVKQFTEWFKSLDDETKRVGISVALAAAAIGPLLSIVGKMISPISTVVKSVIKFRGGLEAMAVAAQMGKGSLEGVGASIGGFAGKSATGVKAATGLSKGLSAITSAGGLAAIALVAVVAAFAFDQWQKYEEHQKTVKKATDGLRDATDSYRDAYDSVSPSIDTASESMGKYAGSLDETLQKQADFAQEIADTWSGLGTDASVLDTYMETIGTLAGKTNLSKEEQIQLTTAIAGVNDICGTTYSVIDAQNGILSENKDAIYKTVDAWKANALAQASQEAMVEAQKRQLELDKQVADATEVVKKRQEELNEARKKSGMTPSAIGEYQQAVNNAQKTLDTATDSANANKETIDKMGQTYAESAQKVLMNSDSVKKYIAANGEISAVLKNSEVDVGAFSSAIADAGITQEQLAKMTPEQMSAVAAAWAGGSGDIKPILQDYKNAVSGTMDSSTEAIKGFVASHQEFATSLEQSGINVDAFSQNMSTLGISTGELAKLSDEKLLEIAQSYDGNLANVITKCDEFGVVVPERMRTAAANGSLFSTEAFTLGTPAHNAAVEALKNGAITIYDPISGSMKAITELATLNMQSSLVAGQVPANIAASGLRDSATSGVAGADGQFSTTGSGYVSAFAKPLYDANGVSSSAEQLPAQADSGARSKDGSGAGENFAHGFVNNIATNTVLGRVAVEAAKLATKALDALNHAQDSRSPSRKTKKAAGWFVAGWVNRLKAGKKDSYDSGFNISKAAVEGASNGIKDIEAMNLTLPSVGIDWYARGGIYNAVSAAAGPEAVVPLLGRRMQPFAEAIAGHMPGE
ncbi:MAG: phage tail tape measure protein, partial [Raoultibacter sp.]